MDIPPEFRGSYSAPLLTHSLVPGYTRIPWVRLASPPSFDSLLRLRSSIQAGLGLEIEPTARFDLTAIAPVLPDLQALYLAGRVKDYQGLEHLLEARELRTLVANGLTNLDLAHLPNLREVHTSGRSALRALENRSVRRLYLTIAAMPSGAALSSELEVVSISSKADLQLAFDSPPTRLSFLSLSAPASITLTGARGSRSLTHLMLHSKAVFGLEEVLSSSLRGVTLSGVQTMPGAAALGELDLEWFEVDPNYLFDDEFRTKLLQKPGYWHLPPMRRTGRAMPHDIFSVREAGGEHEVVFSDWSAATELMASLDAKRSSTEVNVDTFANLLQAGLRRRGVDTDSFVDDSGGDEVIFIHPSESAAMATMLELGRLWLDRETLGDALDDIRP